MSISIVGNKIRLTETEAEHLPQIMTLEQDNLDFIGSFDRAGHQAFMHTTNSLHLSMIDLSNEEFVGFMLLDDVLSPHRHIEFKRFVVGIRQKGFGREAIRLCKKLCFEQLNTHSLWLDVFDDNPKAISLYESEGFVFEGTKRECYLDTKGFRSQRFYSMLESEYRPII